MGLKTAAAAEGIKKEAGRIIKGQDDLLEMMLVCLFSGGHILIEGVPGLGKTLSTRVLAAVSGLKFKRIQFTPDMMPSDITGNNVFDMNEGRFHLRKGPVFANLLLADEINRTPPRTQAALLEAMEEKSVTIDGSTLPMEQPFMVLATQNPIEFEGTYPLPEAQLDRFLIKLNLDYPDEKAELDMLKNHAGGFNAADVESMNINPVITKEMLGECKDEISHIRIDDSVMSYILSIVRATRNSPVLMLGASPRASVALMTASRALAAMEDRDYVIPEDIKQLALPVLRHRVIVSPESEIDGISADRALTGIVEGIKVPR